MANDEDQDQLVLIKIEGMHCHRCEKAIQNALSAHRGVREVEVDFNSGQASVLFAKGSLTVDRLMASVGDAGYRVTGFKQAGA
jgi:copper chaperone CopZ